MTPALDPALDATLRAALSLLFASAAAHKLRDPAHFRAALAGYELVPARWVGPTAAALVAVEIGVAVGFWWQRSAAALAAAALLALYGAAIAANLLRGRRDIDCGCAGPLRRRPLSGWLVVRNAGLAMAALASALPVAPRPLLWIDAVTIAAAVAALALLSAGAEGLGVQAPRVAALRRHGAGIAAHNAETAHA